MTRGAIDAVSGHKPYAAWSSDHPRLIWYFDGVLRGAPVGAGVLTQVMLGWTLALPISSPAYLPAFFTSPCLFFFGQFSVLHGFLSCTLPAIPMQ